MRLRGVRAWGNLFVVAALGWVLLTTSQDLKAQAPTKGQSQAILRGGPRGAVRTSKGFPPEGIMVQLISQKTSIRTTVYTNGLGQYEFPKLDSGNYMLRVPRPLEYKRYQKDLVVVNGATPLEDIILDRVSDSEFLPPTPEILSQLTDAEWLYNLPGTGQEKKIFSNSCGGSCHSYQMQFRSKFDERSWRLIVHRMRDYGGNGGRLLLGPPPESRAAGDRPARPADPRDEAEREILIQWLTKVRGPEAAYPPIKPFGRAQGPATRAIVTEYEIPSVGVHVHDVWGDAEGNIWYTLNRSPYIGKLDPKTGKVIQYRTPNTEGKHPGAHWIRPAKDGTVWYSETWTSNLINFDPKSGRFHVMNTGVQGNMALSPDGSIWRTANGKINEYNRETGKPIRSFPMQKFRSTYGNFISWDGNFFGGGVGGAGNADLDGVVWMNIKTGEVREIETPNGPQDLSRGAFDPAGNIWVGGKHGVLAKYDPKAGVYTEYVAPTPYTTFYSAEAAKNGEIWAGEVRAGKMGRFNPRTNQWIEYSLPEPFSFNWNTYVDNSTDPVSVWYGDQYGYIVHIQLLE